MDREDKRGIFFGVVGVLTLIVAIIGASLAWFSINAQSRENALTVQAASVQIVYEDGNGIEVNNLIPSTKEIAIKTLTRYLGDKVNGTNSCTDKTSGEKVPCKKCIDDNNNVVCAVYEFNLKNNGVNAADITAKIVPTALPVDEETGKTTVPEFKNLKYSLYDITDVAKHEASGERNGAGTAVYTLTGGTDGLVTYTPFEILPNATTINGNGAEKAYRLFIWLDEKGNENNVEQGAEFYGTVYIDVEGEENENQITGTLDPETGA